MASQHTYPAQPHPTLPSLQSPVALICGSREMIEQTRNRLQQMGFAPEEILTNY